MKKHFTINFYCSEVKQLFLWFDNKISFDQTDTSWARTPNPGYWHRIKALLLRQNSD